MFQVIGVSSINFDDKKYTIYSIAFCFNPYYTEADENFNFSPNENPNRPLHHILDEKDFIEQYQKYIDMGKENKLNDYLKKLIILQ